jgi:hypothetical protein
MPVIRVEYDDAVVSQTQAHTLCEAAQKIVSKTTGSTDVFVYGNSSQIKIKIAPIEIWVEMTERKIPNEDALIGELKARFHSWKTEVKYPHPINLTLMPMHWKVEIDI